MLNMYLQIIAEMRNLADNSCPTGFECEVYTIGQSYEGVELYVLKVRLRYCILGHVEYESLYM